MPGPRRRYRSQIATPTTAVAARSASRIHPNRLRIGGAEGRADHAGDEEDEDGERDEDAHDDPCRPLVLVVSRQTHAGRVALGAEERDQQIDEPPDAVAAEGDEFQEPRADLPEVEAVNTEDAEQIGQKHRHDEALVAFGHVRCGRRGRYPRRRVTGQAFPFVLRAGRWFFQHLSRPSRRQRRPGTRHYASRCRHRRGEGGSLLQNEGADRST